MQLDVDARSHTELFTWMIGVLFVLLWRPLYAYLAIERGTGRGVYGRRDFIDEYRMFAVGVKL